MIGKLLTAVALGVMLVLSVGCEEQDEDEGIWTQAECAEFSAVNGYAEVRCPNGRIYHD